MALVKAQCSNCGGKIEVNSEAKQLTCQFCGMEFIVQDAINTYNTNITNNNTYNIASANILLDSFNEQEELNNAKNMISIGDFEGAIKKYEEIYVHNPNNADASLLKSSEKYDIDKIWNTIKNLANEGSSKADVISLLIYKYKNEFILAFDKAKMDFREFLALTKNFINQHLVDDLVKIILDDLFNDLYNRLKKYNSSAKESRSGKVEIVGLEEIIDFEVFFSKMEEYYSIYTIYWELPSYHEISEKLNKYKQPLLDFNLLSEDSKNKIDYVINGYLKIKQIREKTNKRGLIIGITILAIIFIIVFGFKGCS